MRYPGTTKWNGRARRSRKASAHFFIVSDEYITSSVRVAIPNKVGRASSLCLDSVATEVSSETQTLTDRGVLCSCPCDKYSYM